MNLKEFKEKVDKLYEEFGNVDNVFIGISNPESHMVSDSEGNYYGAEDTAVSVTEAYSFDKPSKVNGIIITNDIN